MRRWDVLDRTPAAPMYRFSLAAAADSRVVASRHSKLAARLARRRLELIHKCGPGRFTIRRRKR